MLSQVRCKSMVKQKDYIDFLELKPERYLRELQKKLDIYEISFQATEEQVTAVFMDTIDADIVEVTNQKEATRGKVYIKKDKTGKYMSIKNIRFSLVDFFERIFQFVETLQSDSKYWRIIVGSVALLGMFKQFGIELDEEMTGTCVALYQASKGQVITDESVVEVVNRQMEESGYEVLDEEEIYACLSEMIKLGIVTVVNGRYKVVEKIFIL